MTSTDFNGEPILILSAEEALWLANRLRGVHHLFIPYNIKMLEQIAKKAEAVCLASDQRNSQ